MPKGKSLNIGLNRVDPASYEGWSGPLLACEADARDMADIAKTAGFETRKLLTEKANRHNVLTHIREAAESLKAGDKYLLTYSGHGGSLPDRNNDEFDDGQDETWCLYDGQLVDDEIYAALGAFQAGVRVVVISDSCHSGTVTREAGGFPLDAIVAQSAVASMKVMPPMVAYKTYDANRNYYDAILADEDYRDAWQQIDASVLLLAACQDSQTALDGTFNGLFTGTLLRTWNRGAFRGGYRAFFDAIARRLPLDHMPNYFKTGTPLPGFDGMRPFEI